jgi:hypothetical protein
LTPELGQVSLSVSETKPNGQEPTGSERLDRIERELALMPEYRALFREKHKELLAAQVRLDGQLERLSVRIDKTCESLKRFKP